MWPVVALTDKANRCGMRNVQLFRLDPNPKLFATALAGTAEVIKEHGLDVDENYAGHRGLL
jgi:hypothetical protein